MSNVAPPARNRGRRVQEGGFNQDNGNPRNYELFRLNANIISSRVLLHLAVTY
jgi:hypothetical protein